MIMLFFVAAIEFDDEATGFRDAEKALQVATRVERYRTDRNLMLVDF
jgi:hypothetical protein